MPRTVSIPEDVHTLIINKQKEIYDKYKVTVRISDLIAVIVRNGIDDSERLLGLGNLPPTKTDKLKKEDLLRAENIKDRDLKI